MGNSDKLLRQTSIPLNATIWGYNRGTYSDTQIAPDPALLTGLPTYGDMTNFKPNAGLLSTINPVRVLLPHYGKITSANLALVFSLQGVHDNTHNFRVALGYLDGTNANAASKYNAVTSYSDAYLNASHQLITGKSSPVFIQTGFTFNQYSNFKLNLKPAMDYRDTYLAANPTLGGTQKEDCFVVLLCFDAAPGTTSADGYAFYTFDVELTISMGLQ